MMTRFGFGFFLSPIFKWQRRNLSRAKGKGGKSSHGRRAADSDMGIFLTEHNTTEHSLDGTIYKNYLEPQDEVGSSQKDGTTCKIREEPQDEASNALLSKLAGLIKKRDWDLLSIDLRARREELRDEYKGKLLHIALRFDALLFIISQITHDTHASANHRDDQGRLPLHVAIRKVSQLSIISHLLALNPRACTSVDDQGSTPLHTCFEENVMHAFKPPSQFRELVRLLIQNSPESLVIEDKQGSRCPIEQAILSDAPLKTILFMNVSKRNYLRQKYDPIGYASYIENSIVLKDIEPRHVSGRIGVTMFG